MKEEEAEIKKAEVEKEAEVENEAEEEGELLTDMY